MRAAPRGVPPALDGRAFRDAMALLAAPLTIVTTRDTAGRAWGFTAGSVTSVSLDPPLLLVGIADTSSCFGAFAEAPEFMVNVLGGHHRELARRFAAREVDRFAGQPFHPPAATDGTDVSEATAPPRLVDAHVALRCTVADRIPAGDHVLLLGRPTEVHTTGPDSPLIWHGRQFHTL